MEDRRRAAKLLVELHRKFSNSDNTQAPYPLNTRTILFQETTAEFTQYLDGTNIIYLYTRQVWFKFGAVQPFFSLLFMKPKSSKWSANLAATVLSSNFWDLSIRHCCYHAGSTIIHRLYSIAQCYLEPPVLLNVEIFLISAKAVPATYFSLRYSFVVLKR